MTYIERHSGEAKKIQREFKHVLIASFVLLGILLLYVSHFSS